MVRLLYQRVMLELWRVVLLNTHNRLPNIKDLMHRLFYSRKKSESLSKTHNNNTDYQQERLREGLGFLLHQGNHQRKKVKEENINWWDCIQAWIKVSVPTFFRIMLGLN